MPTASDIDDVIAFAPTDIAEVAYGVSESLYAQMTAWTNGMFAAAGIFPPADNQNPGPRLVTNWYEEHLKAILLIDGSSVANSNPMNVAACINAVVRAAYAVKYAVLQGAVSSAKQTAVVNLFNSVWV